jgi:hypothetical protein
MARKLVLALILLCMTPLFAKRIRPHPVAPIVSDNIKYSAEGDGTTAYVVAADAATGEIFWRAKIFHIHLKPWIEGDNQWVFISGLRLNGKNILVQDERSHCYSLDSMTRRVRKVPCR